MKHALLHGDQAAARPENPLEFLQIIGKAFICYVMKKQRGNYQIEYIIGEWHGAANVRYMGFYRRVFKTAWRDVHADIFSVWPRGAEKWQITPFAAGGDEYSSGIWKVATRLRLR